MSTQFFLLLCGAILCVNHSLAEQCGDCDCSANVMKCEGLNSLPETLAPGIEELICDGCNLADITIIPASYSQLKALLLRECGIKTIEDNVFQDLKSLETLDLMSNYLSHIGTKPAIFAGLGMLKSLYLSTNQISEIGENAFTEMPMLSQVDLSFNSKIKISPKAFANIPIERLNLKQCHLTAIPKELLQNSKGLTTLDLHGNNLTVLADNSFSALSELDTLNLDSCGITDIQPKAFEGVKKLSALYLGNNKISKISKEAFKNIFGQNRFQLRLENNELQSLAPNFPLENIQEIHLGHNPWMCDCKIAWMKDIDLKNLDPENVTCATPAEVAGNLVQNVTSSLDCPQTGGGKSTLALAIVIPILIICVFLILYYVYKIIQRRKADKRQKVHYSAVYKETTEVATRPNDHKPSRPVSEL